jgi:pimeloyl-ACP methyl ester carboxylesterase
MSKQNVSIHDADINGIRMHYLDFKSDGPPIMLLHSLSANAWIFQGLIANGLSLSHRLIIPDLRGRGSSSKGHTNHSLEAEASDLIALLDHLGLERVILGGHSFGGLLATYMAAHHPERVARLIVLDAAVELNPLTPFLISYASGRLFTSFPSWEVYVEAVRKAPFMDVWDVAFLPFLQADVITGPQGTIHPRNTWIDIGAAATAVFSIQKRAWSRIFSSVRQPALLLVANRPFAHGQHIVTEDKAVESAVLVRDCELQYIDGNHITMLFGHGAGQIAAAIRAFATSGKAAVV